MDRTFPFSEGGFNMWLPSVRTEASTASLFFYLIQESPILRSVIQDEVKLSINTTTNNYDYLTTKTNWTWLNHVVKIVNELDLIPTIRNNSLMWSCQLQSEMTTEVNICTGEILCRKVDSQHVFISRTLR
eukprot:TRINITY_DN785_c0_g1_i22.p1 TRINITY_DN785_c0_g1~~TRINITY_DN785_c0_g1_i22.p1  ORF type:complete len:130 (+),score=1.05 TRINITY_DN785_c0_g1_i22:41-430(+)